MNISEKIIAWRRKRGQAGRIHLQNGSAVVDLSSCSDEEIEAWFDRLSKERDTRRSDNDQES
ncbi:hypothetical protein ACGF0J_02160 [Nonomuraea sp. NPDC047897]|uniref:hypothetical protein n=1 Tax=Nonomuraea sp. NPDC047897 TaxID=3364346 RepID=UPI003722E397